MEAVQPKKTSVLLWGSNVFGELGLPTDSFVALPTPCALMTMSKPRAVAVGSRCTYVISESGRLFFAGATELDNKGRLAG
jgi:hypothetical protein